MALNIMDLVITIFWSVMFIVAAIVCFIGLRPIITFCAPGLASAIAWRNIPYVRIISLVFGTIYLAYGIFFITLRDWTPVDEKGWVGGVGYLLVLLHAGAQSMINEMYEREHQQATQIDDVITRQ
ncbi:MAG: hypothetical protein JWM07_677 [Candidatus Saccharibacteria bacterium]|nr:hypothetical protein [Candidatus Saccharibacteria bacterium]